MQAKQTTTIDPTTETITARPFQHEDDYWAVRELLIETYPLIPPDWNWEIRRWEGRRPRCGRG